MMSEDWVHSNIWENPRQSVFNHHNREHLHPGPHANSMMGVDKFTKFSTDSFLCCATFCVHVNVTSQTIMCPNPNPNQKIKPKLGPQIPNPNA